MREQYIFQSTESSPGTGNLSSQRQKTAAWSGSHSSCFAVCPSPKIITFSSLTSSRGTRHPGVIVNTRLVQKATVGGQIQPTPDIPGWFVSIVVIISHTCRLRATGRGTEVCIRSKWEVLGANYHVGVSSTHKGITSCGTNTIENYVLKSETLQYISVEMCTHHFQL